MLDGSDFFKHIFLSAVEALVEGEIQQTIDAKVHDIMCSEGDLTQTDYENAIADMQALISVFAGAELLKNKRKIKLSYGSSLLTDIAIESLQEEITLRFLGAIKYQGCIEGKLTQIPNEQFVVGLNKVEGWRRSPTAELLRPSMRSRARLTEQLESPTIQCADDIVSIVKEQDPFLNSV